MKRPTYHRNLSFGITVFLLMCPASVSSQGFDRSVRSSEFFEAAIPTDQQDARADKRLKQLHSKRNKRPNIVWIVVDDMGYGDPGCYGGGIAIGASTPNMNALAAGGLRLTSCYSQQTCTPTRSAILTGRLPVRTGLTRPILAGDKITKNPWADETSLPSVLSEAGYFTLLTGKWHVGESEGMRPHDVGFDEYYGYYSAQKEITQRIDTRRYPGLTLNPQRLADYEAVGPSDALIHGFKNGETSEISRVKSTEDMGKADEVLTQHTIAKIKELAKSGQPFFIEHCFMKVHADNFAHPDFAGKSEAKYPYKDAIHEVDHHVGSITKAIQESGLVENTLIFLTSDNGPQMDAWPDAGYTPFRGAKGTTFEGGVRVPGIAYWPGMIEAGQTKDGLFDLMDLFGVAMHLAGVSRDELPQDRFYDFVDQTSFLLDADGISRREAVYMWWGNQLMATRMKEYKAHVKVILPQATHKYIDLALVHDVGLAPWYFNLFLDPKEEMSVGHRLDPWMATVGGKLKAHAATFKRFPPKQIGL